MISPSLLSVMLIHLECRKCKCNLVDELTRHVHELPVHSSCMPIMRLSHRCYECPLVLAEVVALNGAWVNMECIDVP